MSQSPAWVFILDDDVSVQKALRRLLKAEGFQIETFSTAAEFLACSRPDAPSCLVLDLQMPDTDGLHFQQELLVGEPSLPVIFISGHGSIPLTVQAVKSGAIDFLQKPVDRQELIRAVGEAIEKDVRDRNARSDLSVIAERLKTLSPREREVLGYVVAGNLNKQIAHRLGITEKTIKVHRGNVMRRMQVRSLAELVHMAQKLGIVGPQHETSRDTSAPLH